MLFFLLYVENVRNRPVVSQGQYYTSVFYFKGHFEMDLIQKVMFYNQSQLAVCHSEQLQHIIKRNYPESLHFLVHSHMAFTHGSRGSTLPKDTKTLGSDRRRSLSLQCCSRSRFWNQRYCWLVFTKYFEGESVPFSEKSCQIDSSLVL